MQTESNQIPAQRVASDTTIVRLMKPHSIYNPGEIAGFRTAVADFLVAKGIAELVAQPPAPKEPTKDTKMSGGPPKDKQTIPGVVKK